MDVEIYEIEETTGTETEEEREKIEATAMALVEDMALEGQKKLIVESEIGDGVKKQVRIPYPIMKKSEIAIYEVMFPVKISIERYEMGIIPARVLQAIKHAQMQGIFDEIQIWYDDDPTPDPAVIGLRKTKNAHGYDEHHKHLIARWGDALFATDDLRDFAEERLLKRWKEQVSDKLAECKEFLASLGTNVSKRLRGEFVWPPVLLLSLMLLCGCATTERDDFSISLHGGASSWDWDGDSFFGEDYEIEGGFAGFGLDWRFNDYASIGMISDFGQNDVEVDIDGYELADGDFDYIRTLFTMRGYPLGGEYPVDPYGFFGFGVMTGEIELEMDTYYMHAETSETETDTMFQVGLGVDVPLGEHVFIRSEWRHSIYTGEFDKLDEDAFVVGVGVTF
jgi:opacity protein-like surface antigen